LSIVQYKLNEQDKPIVEDITNQLAQSLEKWYGKGSRLDPSPPAIRSYRNCFILRYPILDSNGQIKYILVKVRRNPKMDSLSGVDDFGVIRPLEYIEKYHAIVMEEFPSRTLRQILINHRTAKNGADMSELVDAATKTGKWLHYFHHHVHSPEETPYSSKDILKVVQDYAERLEDCSHGRANAQALVEAFSRKLKNVQIESMLFSQSHADMTCDNALYSYDNKVCIIDIKTRLAPIYSDLGLILIHPETFKPQIFSGGTYLSESILKVYRDAILKGYFGDELQDEYLVQIYSAIKVLDKWTMYEELMSRYKGLKHLLAVPVGPFVTTYFQSVLKKHLNAIQGSDMQQEFKIAKPADPAV
jgi:hypothetical protein